MGQREGACSMDSARCRLPPPEPPPACDCWGHHSSETLCPRDCCQAGWGRCGHPTSPITLLRAPFAPDTDRHCAGQSQQNPGVSGEGDTKHHQERKFALPCCWATWWGCDQTPTPRPSSVQGCQAMSGCLSCPVVFPRGPLYPCVPPPLMAPQARVPGGACSPISAGLMGSDSLDLDMEGTWSGLRASPLSASLPPGDMGLPGGAVGLI